jgi:hypothetical protein
MFLWERMHSCARVPVCMRTCVHAHACLGGCVCVGGGGGAHLCEHESKRLRMLVCIVHAELLRCHGLRAFSLRLEWVPCSTAASCSYRQPSERACLPSVPFRSTHSVHVRQRLADGAAQRPQHQGHACLQDLPPRERGLSSYWSARKPAMLQVLYHIKRDAGNRLLPTTW